MTQIALKLYTMNADALTTFAADIHAKMTVNDGIFTTPVVSMAELLLAINDLRDAQQNTLMGGVAATVIRNEKRRRLENMLKALANYVWNLDRGNEETITLAGMPLKRRGPQRYDFIATPLDLRAESLYGEAVSLRWQKVSNAKAYEIEYCMDPVLPENWKKSPIVSASRTMINGLQRKEEYWFRVRALGSQGMVSSWSNPVKQLVS